MGAIVARDAALRGAEQTHSPPVPQRIWEAAVGTRIAARARPYKLQGGVLYVQTASATWAQELSLLSDAIVEHLRARGVELSALRFRVGSVEPPERPPWRSEVRKAPPSAKLPPEVREELAHVRDEGLRHAIADAAAKNLGWQQTLGAGPRPKRPSRKEPAAATSESKAAPDPQSAASENARSARSRSKAAGAPPRRRGSS